jgi:uncharacterized protein HemX
LALARTALARADETNFRRSLAHNDTWLQRLYPDGALLRDRRARLKRLARFTLAYDLPIAGSSLQQLQELQRSRRSSR